MMTIPHPITSQHHRYERPRSISHFTAWVHVEQFEHLATFPNLARTPDVPS